MKKIEIENYSNQIYNYREWFCISFFIEFISIQAERINDF